MFRFLKGLPHYLSAILTILLVSFIVPNTANAFYEFEDIKRREYNWQVEMLDSESLEVKLTQKLENTSNKAITFEYLFPLLPHAREERFFVDALGQDFKVLEGRERLTRLFQKAKTTDKPMFFRLGAPPYGKLFAAENITIEPGETITLKLAFKTSLDFVNDIYFSEVFLYDEVVSDHFELSFSIATNHPIWHFFSNLFNDALFERYKNQLVMIFERDNYLPSDNARFFWSHIENPTLLYQTNGEVYHGHFPIREKHADLEEAIIMIDVSGSMNGNPWIRTKEYVNFILERLGESAYVKVVYVDDKMRYYSEEWMRNNYDFRRGLFDNLKSMKPLGKSNFHQAFKDLARDSQWQSDPGKQAFFVITDSEAFIPYDPQVITAPVIALHFDIENTDFDLLTHFSGGFIQGLFKNPPKLIESEELWGKWTDWRKNIVTENFPITEGTQDAVPNVVTGGMGDFGPFITSRKFDQYAAVYSPVAQFLPRVWGARKLAQIFKNPEYSDDQKQAMLSIAHRFGIKRRFLDPELGLEAWKETLGTLERQEIERLIMELETLPSGEFRGARMAREVPFYLDEGNNIWRSYDFHEKASPHTIIHIAPYSPAQQYLFERFPEFVAIGFSVAKKVDFCSAIRCVSVNKNGRETSEVSDRLFFKDYDPAHWANPYLDVLINKGLLHAGANGKLHADRPVDRGEFARMLVGLRSDVEELYTIEKPFFSDVEASSEFFPYVQHLAAKKVTQGYKKDGTFRPLQGLTRAEALKMILAMDGFEPPECDTNKNPECNIENPPFPDITGWTIPWISEAFNRGWVKGFQDGTFRPHQKLTKAEAAKLLLSR